MPDRVYRIDGGRLARRLAATAPLVAAPGLLVVAERGDSILVGGLGGLAATIVAAVVWSAARFRLTLDAQALQLRGPVSRHTVRWAEVAAVKVRLVAPRPTGSGTAPRELVLITDHDRVVVSSLPLGAERFDELVSEVHARVPDPPPEPASTRIGRTG